MKAEEWGSRKRRSAKARGAHNQGIDEHHKRHQTTKNKKLIRYRKSHQLEEANTTLPSSSEPSDVRTPTGEMMSTLQKTALPATSKSTEPMTRGQNDAGCEASRKKRGSGRNKGPRKFQRNELEQADMTNSLSPPMRGISDEIQIRPGAEAVAGVGSSRPHTIRRSRSQSSNISLGQETELLEAEIEGSGATAGGPPSNDIPPNLCAELVQDPPRASVVTTDDEIQQKLQGAKRKIRFYLIAGAVVLILVVVGVTVGLLVSNRAGPTPVSTETPTAAPTFFEERLAALIHAESPNTSFETETSPQSLALDWVSSDEYSKTLSDFRIIQRFALATFFYSTGGSESWNYTSGWLEPNSNECEWVSVECDSQNRSIGLRLDEAGLSGTLPKELGLLIFINYFYFWNNQLSGTLPSELGNIEGMFGIDLAANQLEGTIPSELGKITGMLNLWLAKNKFNGNIPIEALSEMTNLQVLSLEFNSFAGTIPSEVGAISNTLEELVFRHNNLTGIVPSEIGMLQRLRLLDLAHNELSGNLPSDLGKLTQRLTYMDLGGNSLTGTVPTDFGTLTVLTILSLRENSLGGTLPVEMILKLRALRELYLYSNQFEGTLTTELGQFRGDLLWFHGNNLTGTVPSQFGQLKTLTSLSLFDNNLTGTLPVEAILKMTGLIALRLDRNKFRGPISTALGQFKGEELWLNRNELTGTVVVEVGWFPNIRLLELSGNQLFGSNSASFCESQFPPSIRIDCDGDISCDCCLHPYPSSDNC